MKSTGYSTFRNIFYKYALIILFSVLIKNILAFVITIIAPHFPSFYEQLMRLDSNLIWSGIVNIIVAIIIYVDRKKLHIPKSIFAIIILITILTDITGIGLMLIAYLAFSYEKVPADNEI